MLVAAVDPRESRRAAQIAASLFRGPAIADAALLALAAELAASVTSSSDISSTGSTTLSRSN
jgi:hypothetical protein